MFTSSVSFIGKLLPCKIPSCYSKLELYKTLNSDEAIDGTYSLQYSPDGSVLAVGTGNEAMRVSPITTCRPSIVFGLVMALSKGM